MSKVTHKPMTSLDLVKEWLATFDSTGNPISFHQPSLSEVVEMVRDLTKEVTEEIEYLKDQNQNLGNKVDDLEYQVRRLGRKLLTVNEQLDALKEAKESA